ncbi:glyoxylase I family protein [Streptomyces sp. 3213]|uniref:VOC family protein n=1 Tax=Streptomyces sp. 3213.3 TaxID=1855348 RepID=UPI0008952E9F|nr:VOC family protein [Streptomyces sp. 3213.3]SEE57105.1 glyoxylase I family protein [Streptomyces sp. 3213] [Streptomyces sp. 3213.3]
MCSMHPTAAAAPQASAATTAIDHVGLSVRDLDAAVVFYTKALGLTEEFRFEVEDQRMRVVVLRAADGYAVELMSRPDSVPSPPASDPNSAVLRQGYGHFCLRVTDLDGLYDRVLAAGASVIVPPGPAPHPDVRFGYLADPEGNLIELIQIREGATL